MAASEKVDLEMRRIIIRVKDEMSYDCIHSLYIRPIRFWFCMKDHKYTWFLQFSWFWIS